jgi:hypothetical protein
LLVLQLMFALHCYGRSLGVDAMLVAEQAERSQANPRLSRRVVALFT